MNLLQTIRGWFIKPDPEMVALENMERAQQDIPTEAVGLAKKALASNWRLTGVVYHNASLLYLSEHPNATFEIFDALPRDQKTQYINRAETPIPRKEFS